MTNPTDTSTTTRATTAPSSRTNEPRVKEEGLRVRLVPRTLPSKGKLLLPSQVLDLEAALEVAKAGPWMAASLPARVKATQLAFPSVDKHAKSQASNETWPLMILLGLAKKANSPLNYPWPLISMLKWYSWKIVDSN